MSTRVAALKLETIVIDHLADVTTGSSTEEATPAHDRWRAVVMLLSAALRPGDECSAPSSNRHLTICGDRCISDFLPTQFVAGSHPAGMSRGN